MISANMSMIYVWKLILGSWRPQRLWCQAGKCFFYRVQRGDLWWQEQVLVEWNAANITWVIFFRKNGLLMEEKVKLGMPLTYWVLFIVGVAGCFSWRVWIPHFIYIMHTMSASSVPCNPKLWTLKNLWEVLAGLPEQHAGELVLSTWVLV